jgi:hypothetical protein
VSLLFFDACAIIYLIEAADPWATRVRDTLIRLRGDQPDTGVAVSDLSRLECRVRPIRDGQHDLLATYNAFFSADGLTIVPLSPGIVDPATTIRAKTKLRTPDALKVACFNPHSLRQTRRGSALAPRRTLSLGTQPYVEAARCNKTGYGGTPASRRTRRPRRPGWRPAACLRAGRADGRHGRSHSAAHPPSHRRPVRPARRRRPRGRGAPAGLRCPGPMLAGGHRPPAHQVLALTAPPTRR